MIITAKLQTEQKKKIKNFKLHEMWQWRGEGKGRTVDIC